MSTISEPHLACHHTGYEFDWWRCKERGYVGRPPSPFPASFETPRGWRIDSADPRHESWALPGTKSNAAGSAGTGGATNNGAGTGGAGNTEAGTCNAGKNGAGACGDVNNDAGNRVDHTNGDILPPDENMRYTIRDSYTGTQRLYWPIYQGPGFTEPLPNDDLANIDTLGGLVKKIKKTPKPMHAKPPWVPTKMPNKWGVAGHPPPYTNYCKETLFNTNTANPGKVTIRTSF